MKVSAEMMSQEEADKIHRFIQFGDAVKGIMDGYDAEVAECEANENDPTERGWDAFDDILRAWNVYNGRPNPKTSSEIYDEAIKAGKSKEEAYKLVMA